MFCFVTTILQIEVRITTDNVLQCTIIYVTTFSPVDGSVARLSASSWSHRLISSSKNSCGTRCYDDFLVVRAVYSGNLVRKECEHSCLLVGSCKKSAQIAWSLFLPETFLRKPFPCFSLVDSLMLLEMYVSHTISILLEFSSCFLMCGTNT